MRDLQRRLTGAGFPPGGSEWGLFCEHTEAAVRAFQVSRGLRADGQCDDHTWQALTEATWSLGDRVLYHRSPNLRGDDVGELQRRLGRLGFDAGRVDGIFGPATASALEDFQRNMGLNADGVCGIDSVQALSRLGGRTEAGPGIARVREEEKLRATRSLAGLRVVVGQFGGVGVLTRGISRTLRSVGSIVLTADEPDQPSHAQAANRFGADVDIVVQPAASPGVIAYYATTGFESIGGHRLAVLVHDELEAEVPGVATSVVGMRLPVLRETRMPAILCELGPAALVLDRAPLIAAAVRRALTRWVKQTDVVG